MITLTLALLCVPPEQFLARDLSSAFVPARPRSCRALLLSGRVSTSPPARAGELRERTSFFLSACAPAVLFSVGWDPTPQGGRCATTTMLGPPGAGGGPCGGAPAPGPRPQLTLVRHALAGEASDRVAFTPRSASRAAMSVQGPPVPLSVGRLIQPRSGRGGLVGVLASSTRAARSLL